MNFSAGRRSKIKGSVETLAVFMFEDEPKPLGLWESLDIHLQKKIAEQAAREKFKAGEKQLLTFYPQDARPAPRVIAVGLGKRSKFGTEYLRRGCGRLAATARTLGLKNLTILLPENLKLESEPRELAQACVEGVALALYEYRRYKTSLRDDSSSRLETVMLVVDSEKNLSETNEGLRRGELYAQGTCLTRDLVNEPASAMTPTALAEVAKRLGRGKSTISVKILDEKKMRRLGMGAVLGVAAGSDQPPRFVHLTYKAPGAKKTIALVGKGITFDSGGLCIKTAEGMLNMKDDMGGAAAILGIFSVLPEVKPKVTVHGIFPATENMPGGSAYKTRDILRAMNGKTIEIINTDAEGRLILSDALSYASRLKPDEIIDMATLTAACVVALGTEISGIFSTDQDLAHRIIRAGQVEGEKIWPLPLEEEYGDLIKSDVADIKNSGGRYGGAITAALLLKQFVDEGISWAHIDIAGPCLTDSAKPYTPPGGTGVIVRTILRYLEEQR